MTEDEDVNDLTWKYLNTINQTYESIIGLLTERINQLNWRVYYQKTQNIINHVNRKFKRLGGTEIDSEEHWNSPRHKRRASHGIFLPKPKKKPVKGYGKVKPRYTTTMPRRVKDPNGGVRQPAGGKVEKKTTKDKQQTPQKGIEKFGSRTKSVKYVSMLLALVYWAQYCCCGCCVPPLTCAHRTPTKKKAGLDKYYEGDEPRVIIDNLIWTVTEEQVKEFFSACGMISLVHDVVVVCQHLLTFGGITFFLRGSFL